MSVVKEEDVKRCCAAFYGSELARVLLGESFHPGGTALTQRLGHLIQLARQSRVLDVAAGRGTSAFHIAQWFGCEVVGVDLSEENVKRAAEEAASRGVSNRVTFRMADAGRLPFEAASFDAILCECAFCTFPHQQIAGEELFRMLRPEGRLGLSDLTKTADPLPELDGLLSWVACIGGAQPVEGYTETLERANFRIERIEDHSQALADMVRQIQGRLLGVEIAASLRQFELPGADLSDAKRFIRAALGAIESGKLGYTAIVAVKQG